MDQRQKEIQNRIKLELQHGFGSLASKGYKNCVGIFDDDDYNHKVIFPIGQYVGVKQLDQQDMNFIKLNETTESISCMAICSKRKLIALCEKQAIDPEDGDNTNTQQKPFLSIYNLQKSISKNNFSTDCKSFKYGGETIMDSFIAIGFSNDGRFLVCLTGNPEYKLIFLDLNSNKKELASVFLHERLSFIQLKEDQQQKINKITICPKDSNLIGLTGPEYFQILQFKEQAFSEMASELRPLIKKKNNQFTDHVWIDNKKIALSTSIGEIFIISEYEIKQYIQNAFERHPNLNINCLCAFSKGLLIAGDNGNFSVWIKSEEDSHNKQAEEGVQSSQQYPNQIQYITHLREWTDKKQNNIVSMDINQNEEIVVIAFKNNHIACLDLSKAIPVVQEVLKQLRRSEKNRYKQIEFDYLYKGFHSGPISSIDVCIQRPLLVTCCSQDSSIIIWNYMNFKCEMARKFENLNNSNASDSKLLLSVAFHPSGYYFAAGFVDKLRIYHVLNDSLRLYKELPVKNCTILKFSNGGQLLAAGFPISKRSYHSSYLINIYNSYTLQSITSLKGHTSTVSEIIWGQNDNILFSCCRDGLVYQWNTYNWEKLELIAKKQGVKINSMLFNQFTGQIMIVGNDEQNTNGCIIQFIKFKEDKNDDHCDVLTIKNYQLSNFVFAKTFNDTTGIVGGTQNGQLKVYQSFFSQNALDTLPVHDGSVTKLAVSFDGKYLFTGGKDGSVFIFSIHEINSDGHLLKSDQNEGQYTDKDRAAVDKGMADVVLVSRQEIEIYLTEQKKLKENFEDLENKMEIQSQEEKNRMERQIKEMEQKMKNEIRQYEIRYDDLKQSKNKNEKENSSLIKDLEKTHLKAIEELENLYEKKLAFENEKYLQQEQELIEERMKFEKKLKEIESKHDYNINSLKTEFNDNFYKAQRVYDNTKQTAEELKKIYEERLFQQEEEHEQEIKDLNEKQKIDIQKLRKELSEAIDKKNKFDEQNKRLREDLTRMEKTDTDKKTKIENLEAGLNEANNQIESLKNEIRSLEDLVKKKEKKIHEYKYKINDLQKSKHVLSYRTSEMRKSLEPKEEQIEKQKDQLCKLEKEFEFMLKQLDERKEKIQKMQSQIDNLTKNLKLQTQLKLQKESELNRMYNNIHDWQQTKDNKEKLAKIFKFFQEIQRDDIKQVNYNKDSIDEMKSQIRFLEKTVQQISQSSHKLLDRRSKDIYNKTKENAELIYDLNDKRQKYKQLESELNTARMEIATLKKQLEAQQVDNQRYYIHKKENIQQQEASIQMNQKSQTNIQKQSQYDNYVQPSIRQQSAQMRPQSSKLGQSGKIYKGSNFDAKTQAIFDKARMMDMMAENELINQKLLQQEVIIRNIRNKIQKHVIDKNCSDHMFEEELAILQAQESGEFQDIDNNDFMEQNKPLIKK